MKRQITGLHAADRSAADQIPDGVFLVRVERAHFRRQANGDPEMLLYSMTRFFKFLPEEQRQAFLGGLNEKAS